MKSTFNILFFVKRDKIKENGKMPLLVRITIDGEAVQFSIKQDITPAIWNPKSGRAEGKTKEAVEVNTLLSSIGSQISAHHRNLVQYGDVVTAAMLRDAFLGFDVKNDTLLKVFADFNDRHEKMIGVDIAQSTFNKYDLTYRRLEEFLKAKKRAEDIPLSKINLDFIMDFNAFLRVDYKMDVNSAEKLLRIFKRIMTIARQNGLIKTDPFGDYKIKKKKKDRGFLTRHELELIFNYEPDSERLSKVRDIFVFCCFTGLDYSSVASLTRDDVVIGVDNKMWIIKHRIKTGIKSEIKLLDVPLGIIKKYEDKTTGDRLLPVMSNAKYNLYLKEIAHICGITKKVTSHLARHTFATTVTLANGVPIDTVSKMLGHTKIATTQIYARTLNTKISTDMDELASKLDYASINSRCIQSEDARLAKISGTN